VTTEIQTPATADTGTPVPAGDPGIRRPRWRRLDPVAVTFFVSGAVYLTALFWADPNHLVLRSNPGDQSFYEWMLAYHARAITQGENPFYTYLQNAPVGVNLMCNASSPLVGWVMAPLTLLAGPHVSFMFVATANLAATGLAWYYVLSRKVRTSGPAALLGAGFCAFAPGMVSQTNAHLHMTAAYLVPFIVWRVTRLGEPGRVRRNGLVLGALVSAQILIGEETLLLTAIGCLVMVVTFAVSRWPDARRMARPFLLAMGIGAAVTVLVDAYPLWMQFFGPNHAAGVPVVYGGDLNAFVTYAQQSIAGTTSVARKVSPNPAEQSSFFGWGLTIAAIGAGIALWRQLAARLAFMTAAVCAVLALNNPLLVGGRRTGVPTPIGLFQHLPLMEALIVLRLSLVTTVAVGVLLALLTDRVRAWARQFEPRGMPVRLLAGAVGVAVLLPLVPKPLPMTPRAPAIPAFVTAGQWRNVVAEGRTLVYVAPTSQTNLAWAAAAGAGYGIVQGYYLFPRSATDTRARWETDGRPTQVLMNDVMKGALRRVDDADRAAARMDVRYWKADAVVLGEHEPQVNPLREATSALFGPPRKVAGAYVWDVRSLSR
jgi:hypothetical protein